MRSAYRLLSRLGRVRAASRGPAALARNVVRRRLIRAVFKVTGGDGGVVSILVAIMLPVLVGCLALSIDVGAREVAEVQIQNAADSAVLSLVTDCDASIAEDLVDMNVTAIEGVTLTVDYCGDWRASVHVEGVVPFYFAGVLGVQSADISAAAVAERAPSGTLRLIG